MPLPEGMDFVTGAAFLLTYAHLRPRAARPRRAEGRRDAAGARRRGRRRPRRDRDRQGARRARHRLRLERGQARGVPRARRRRDHQLRDRGPARAHQGAHRRASGVDVVYDPVGGPYTEPAFRSLAWRGRLLVVGFAAGEIPKLPLNLALLKGASVVGVFWGDFARREPKAVRRRASRQLGQWYARGQAQAARVADLPAGEGRRSAEADGGAPGEGESWSLRSRLASPSPGPSGRCMNTLSTQRPNLKPDRAQRADAQEAAGSRAGRSRPRCALSPITAMSCR